MDFLDDYSLKLIRPLGSKPIANKLLWYTSQTLMRNKQTNCSYRRLSYAKTNSDACPLCFPVISCQIIRSTLQPMHIQYERTTININTHNKSIMKKISIMKVVFVKGKTHLTLHCIRLTHKQTNMQKPPYMTHEKHITSSSF